MMIRSICMQIFQGKSVSHGIAMGPVMIWQKDKFIVECRQVADPEAELVRLKAALELSKAQLLKLQEKVTSEKESVSVAECDKSVSAIFEAQSMLLEDDSFVGQVRDLIQTESVNAEYAVHQVSVKIAGMFADMEDAYMRERAVDIRDIAVSMLRNLSGKEKVSPTLIEPSIILAEDLSPSETVQFDRDKVLAFVTAQGSANSHAAILARSMGIPALVGVDFGQVLTNSIINTCEKAQNMRKEGLPGQQEISCFAIVDAVSGQLIFNPDRQTIEGYNHKMQQEQERKELLRVYKNLESITLDGHKIHICANVGTAEEVQDALKNGVDGIGLFRSEFLYLGRGDFPSEEEQYEEYKRAAVTMENKQVIIRTLDIGADKQAVYFQLEQEENPALGCRGIRVCLKQPEMFKVQLRALFRAAVCGNLAVMYPMITSVEEMEQITRIVKDVATELEDQRIPHKIPAQGIMIETPAAVMVSDELAEMVDFFSIGTNDLVQYTLAVDRQNSKLDDIYNSRHKAILRMIQMVVENAHKAGKWVSICGELAGDVTLTKSFVRMGVDELSVVPGKVLELRKLVREMKADE